MALRYTARFYTIPTLGSHVYDIEIDDANFVGEVKQLELGAGGVVLDYEGDEQDTFPTIIPSYLTINLIADESFQLNHIYTDNERALRVTLKQDGQFLGNYFVLPDGTRESFTSFPYDVSIRCVDGLGLLKNYEYTTIDGKDNIFNIIRKCLNKTGLSLNINTFCRTAYEGGGSLDDQYRFVYVHQERFIGMRCDEVLEQLLKEWVSGLMQMNGEWYLFRWPDLIRTPETVPFSKYDSSGTFIETNSINTDYILGTDGESGLDLIHVNYDQVRSVNMAYKAVKIRYEYGALENLLNKDSATLMGSSSINFEGWDKIGGINAVPRLPYSFENSGNHALINGRTEFAIGAQYLQLKEKIDVPGIDMLKLSITFNVSVANAMAYMVYYEDDVQTLYLREDETWGATIYLLAFNNYVQDGEDGEDTYGLGQKIRGEKTFSLQGITKVGTPTIGIRLYPAYFLENNIYTGHPGIAKVYEVKLQRTNDDDDIISETHEVVNNGSYTTIPDPIEVSTGESFFEGYEGTMFKSDQVTPTNGFKSVGDVNYIPFLTLAARDILFQHGRPMTRYEGSILGYFPILSRLTINDLPGVYMPVRLSYDFKNNIVNSSLNEVNADPVPHVELPIVYEY